MCGADLMGIELRMLAHYLARWDDGRYADVLLHGDIHQENADKIGISRKLVKTVTYAFLYGAGDAKIGYSYDKQLSEEDAKEKGKEIRAAYIKAIPGLGKFLAAVRKASARGYVSGLDGRRILVDSRHKSVNYLIQGSAAILAKRWMLLANKELPIDTHQVAFIHDELQFECPSTAVDAVSYILQLAATEAGEYYNLRIPVAAEAKSGLTWADVH
jgi:DNA polymerase I-like protein with 3'-5' exonuclease and polymerase domains